MSLLEQLLIPHSQSQLIRAAFQDIESMLGHSRRMLELALEALLDNQPLEEDLDRLDDAVDQGERLVRRAVLQHLAMQPSEDLVQSLLLSGIAQDCERLGDSARGLGDMLALAKHPRSGPIRDRLDEARLALLPLFDETARAFQEDDLERAKLVEERAGEAKAQLVTLFGELANSDLSSDMVVVYTSSARILSRVASHLSNVASSVFQPFDAYRHGDEDA